MGILQVDVAAWEDPLWTEDKQTNENPFKVLACGKDAHNQYRAMCVCRLKEGEGRKRETDKGVMGFRRQKR